MFEVCSELGLFPSKFQRPNMHVEELRAAPVWSVEETGQQDHLEGIQRDWTVIRSHNLILFRRLQPSHREELKNLTQELEDWDWHENRALETKVCVSREDWLCRY
jgi:hypothetical protein